MTVGEDRYNKLKATYGDDCVLIDGDDVKKQYHIKVRNIVMGVPITFLDKYCPKQFETVGLDRYVGNNPNFGHRFHLNKKEVYARILIKRVIK